jgi:hypothetical protein
MDRFRAWVSGGKKLARLDKLPAVAMSIESSSD